MRKSIKVFFSPLDYPSIILLGEFWCLTSSMTKINNKKSLSFHPWVKFFVFTSILLTSERGRKYPWRVHFSKFFSWRLRKLFVNSITSEEGRKYLFIAFVNHSKIEPSAAQITAIKSLVYLNRERSIKTQFSPPPPPPLKCLRKTPQNSIFFDLNAMLVHINHEFCEICVSS